MHTDIYTKFLINTKISWAYHFDVKRILYLEVGTLERCIEFDLVALTNIAVEVMP